MRGADLQRHYGALLGLLELKRLIAESGVG